MSHKVHKLTLNSAEKLGRCNIQTLLSRFLPVQHLGGGSLQLLQDLQQLGVVVAQAAPAQNAGQVVPRSQGKDSELALRRGREIGRRWTDVRSCSAKVDQISFHRLLGY